MKIKELFCIHGDFHWEKPNGSPLPMIIEAPPGKMIEVIRVCGRCGQRKTQHWGTVGGEVIKEW